MLHYNSDKNNFFNLLIHKYAIYIHVILFLILLYMADIHPNTGFYWAFLINLGAMVYFIYVNGVAFGIKHTVYTMAEIEVDKKKNDDIDFNNN